MPLTHILTAFSKYFLVLVVFEFRKNAVFEQVGSVRIIFVFFFIRKIVQEDTLPKTICFSCYNQVAEWEVFKHRCHKSQEVLVNGLLNPRTATADHNDKNDGIDEVVSPENITVKQHVESLSRLCSDQLLDSGGIDEKEQIRISPSFCKRPAFASVNPDNFKKWSDSSESEEEDEDECESQDDYCVGDFIGDAVMVI